MAAQRKTNEAKAWEALEEYGLLLVTDTKLPSLAALVAGEVVRGSWWAHPKCHEIHAVYEGVLGDPAVTLVKLVAGKNTIVHQSLWPALLGVATGGREWQTRGLARATTWLHGEVCRGGEVRTDQLRAASRGESGWGDSARELERRLLIHAEDIHTDSGAHAKALETWERWSARVKFAGEALPAEAAEQKLEELIGGLNERFGARAKLPWQMKLGS